jgi:hypothetical protein
MPALVNTTPGRSFNHCTWVTKRYPFGFNPKKRVTRNIVEQRTLSVLCRLLPGLNQTISSRKKEITPVIERKIIVIKNQIRELWFLLSVLYRNIKSISMLFRVQYMSSGLKILCYCYGVRIKKKSELRKKNKKVSFDH